MSKINDKLPFVNIYGQGRHHNNARIEATRQGLLGLKSAIDWALESGASDRTFFASDGEGYSIDIALHDDADDMKSPEYIYELIDDSVRKNPEFYCSTLLPYATRILVYNSIYEKLTDIKPHDGEINTYLMSIYKDVLPWKDEIEEFLEQKSFIVEKIIERQDQPLFRHSSILFLYFLANNRRHQVVKLWPLTPGELRPVFVDLGIVMP